MARFSDYIKLFKMVKTKSDCEELSEAFFKVSEWSTAWQMKFNTGKFVIHGGTFFFKYLLLDCELTETKIIRDFRLLLDNFVKLLL